MSGRVPNQPVPSGRASIWPYLQGFPSGGSSPNPSGQDAVLIIGVDNAAAPGINPVEPTGAGLISVSGAQTAAGSVGANVLRTNSIAINSLQLEVQRSNAVAATDSSHNGVCHFNSADFTLDANGFVSSIGGGFHRFIQVDGAAIPGVNPVVPTAGGLISVSGAQIAPGSTANAIKTQTVAVNSYEVQVQRSKTEAVSTMASNGVCHFNTADFVVDSNGYVSSIGGGGGGISNLIVDSSAVPGTNPVLPVANAVTITGGQVAAGTVPNTIQAKSVAAGAVTIQIQRAKVEAAPTAASNGVCHFNNTQFVVDPTGYVSSIGSGTGGIADINVDFASSPGSSPVIPSGSGAITVLGAQVAAGSNTNAVQTSSRAANTYTLEVQRARTAASSTVGYNGLCHFSSAHFGVDSNGFVTAVGGGGGGFTVAKQTVFTSSGTYTPTAGMAYVRVEVVGSGGGGGGASIEGTDNAPAGSGGGAGMYACKLFDSATIGVSKAVTIGAGGAGGVHKANGADGAATSFGALLSVSGGTKGIYMVSNGPLAEGGDGGNSLVGSPDYSAFGGGGGYAIYIAASSVSVSGVGGNSLLGLGGKPIAVPADGIGGSGFGAGGSGGVAALGVPSTGGNGSSGVVVVTEYIL